MFFIITADEREKQLDFAQSMLCGKCGRFGRYEVFMTYMRLCLFFIPVFVWRKRYYVKTSCCGAIAELDAQTGKAIARGEITGLDPDKLHFTSPYAAYEPDDAPQKTCPNCGYTADADFAYCPKCGGRL